jgi:predicted dehydrogenase
MPDGVLLENTIAMRSTRRAVLIGSLPASSRRAAAQDAVGVGMIGVGNRGSYLLKVVMEEPRARVAAVCDIKTDRLDRAATAAARDKPATATDYRKLLERKDVDAVLIASPCDLHVEMTIAALRADKHVYCEKPVGITPESIAELMRAARSSRPVFMAGQQRRSDMALRQIVARIQEGVAGKVVMIKAQRHAANDFSPTGSSGDWVLNAKRSGDVIVEQAVHNLDTCNWILNSRPERAAGFGGALITPKVPPDRTITDGYTLSFDYPNGVKMAFTQVQFHPPGLPHGGEQTYVYGSAGAVALESGMFYPRAGQEKPVLLAERKRENREARHIALFLDCIRNGSQPETGIVVGATAALTAILGREAMYRQKVLAWKELGVAL